MKKMKPSNTEWIGEIPESWSINRIKYVADFEPKCDFTKLPPDSMITYTPMENIKNGYYIPNTAVLGSLSTSLTAYQDNDIVMAKVTPCFENGNIAVMSGLSSGVGLGSSELFVFRAKEIQTRYLFYWLQNQAFVEQAKATMTGTGGLKRVSPQFMRNCAIHCPPVDEQSRIADFLDTECARIDAVIEQTRASIEEYKKLKQAVITEAVTKGIRPGRKMKDSGSKWIEEVPAEWEVIISRFVLDQIGDVDHYMPESVDAGIPYIMTGDLKKLLSEVDLDSCKKITREDYETLCKKIKLSIGDIIFARYATIGTVCYVDTEIACVVSYSCVTIKPMKDRLFGKYLYYYLQASTFLEDVSQYVNSNTQGNVGIEALYKVKIPIPSIQEQSEISDYLDNKVVELESLIKKKELLLSELNNYKKSLIFEYVTRKKAVVI